MRWCLVIALVSIPHFAFGEAAPATPSAEGKRAFVDLGNYYADKKVLPDDGVEVSRSNVVGDSLAQEINYWKAFGFDILDPDEKRQATRAAMSKWVREQFDLIAAGMKSEIKPDTWSMKQNVLEFAY